MSSPSASSATGTIATGSSPPAASHIGRFAPSPTGPLHFGSLLAAAASYLEARVRGGRWLLRIEDIDPPREQPGATERILAALDAYGFEWDGPVIYQSRNAEAQRAALQELLDAGLAYACGCTRRELADVPAGPLGTIYPGTCRSGYAGTEFAVRIRTDDRPVAVDDRIQGKYTLKLESESGDFVIRRRDGLIAYQLAVVVDDQLQGITDVIRGIDLLDSTPRQIYLQRLLGYRTPTYRHIPVVVNAEGRKLSKSTGAPALPLDAPAPLLAAALGALAQQPPPDLGRQSLRDVWEWALRNWDIERLRGRTAVPEPLMAMAPIENPLR